jgi:TolB protein
LRVAGSFSEGGSVVSEFFCNAVQNFRKEWVEPITPMKTRIIRKIFVTPIVVLASLLLLQGITQSQAASQFELVSTIAFTSTRDCPTPTSSEIFLMNPDGTNVRRLTENLDCVDGDAFPALSLDGKKIVFDSNRLRLPTEPNNTSDLFLMNTDGTEQTYLIRGSSTTWSPDSKNIAFHASASGTGLPTTPNPGAATSDSDIFVANVDDLLARVAGPQNITNNGSDTIDNDPDWSPDGTKIAFTSHPPSDNPNNPIHAEIYVINPDGTELTRLTFNNYEERAPSWSPDGSRIVFMARVGTHGGNGFEICVMNADGTNFVQLTDNAVFESTPTFSPDTQKIVFARDVGGGQELFLMNADGTNQIQLTDTVGVNLFPNWGELRVHIAP